MNGAQVHESVSPEGDRRIGGGEVSAPSDRSPLGFGGGQVEIHPERPNADRVVYLHRASGTCSRCGKDARPIFDRSRRLCCSCWANDTRPGDSIAFANKKTAGARTPTA